MALNHKFTKLFYILLLIIRICKYNSNEIYKIPFGLYNWNEEKKTMDFVQNIFYNLLYVNLTIGTPPQIIPFQLNVNSQAFYISNQYFNPNQSSTYELLSNEEISYEYEYGTYGYKSKDILKINDIEQKVDFIFETKTEKDNNLSNIGLLIPNKIQTGIYPFFSSLKNAGIINSYTWTLKYFKNISLFDTKNDNKIIGEFIIGEEPHNYENNKTIYNENEYIKIRPQWDFDGIYWDIFFDSTYIISKENENEQNLKTKISGYYLTEFNPDISFFVGPNEFFSLIKDSFFKKYKNNCTEKFLDNTLFRYIECDKNDNFNISSFPDIYFENKELETIFNLTYEDLFILDETKNKYIFLVFNNRHTNHWVFGNVFLRKYQFTFNVDSKTIGYYKSMNNYPNDNNNDNQNDDNKKDENKDDDNKDDNNENTNDDKKKDNNKEANKDNNGNNSINENNDNKNENKNKNDDSNKNENNNNININNNQTLIIIIIILIVVIFSTFFLFIGMYIQKKCNKRKKRINELEDEDNDFNDIQKNNSLINKPNKNNKEFNENSYNIN